MNWIGGMAIAVLLMGCQQLPTSASRMTGRDLQQMQMAEDTLVQANQDARSRMKALHQRIDVLAPQSPVPPAVMAPKPDPALDKVVDINMANAPVTDLLSALADQLRVNLVIDPRVIKLAQRTTLSMRRVSAREVLNRIFTLFDLDGELKDRLLSVNLTAQRAFSVDMLASKTQMNVDDGGDVFGSAGKQAGSTALKGNTVINGELGSKADPYDDLLKSVQSIVSGGASSSGKSEDGGYFTFDRISGTLFVNARPSRLAAVSDFVQHMREVHSRQIQIEAQLIDVQLNDGFNLGVDWSLLTNSLAGRIGAGALTIGQATTPFGAGGLGSPTVTIPAQIIGNASGFGNGLAFRGNVFSAAINALRTFGTVRMLSNPVVRLSNGVPAYLNVGTNYRYISKVNSTVNNIGGGSSSNSVDVQTDSLFSGVVVGVSAFVNEVGRIELFVHPTQTQVDQTSLQQVAVGTTGSAVTLPVVDVKGITTTLQLNSGDTVMIGGLISQSASTSNKGLPAIADVPGLGNLFDNVNKQHANRELVIVLRAVLL